MHRLHSDRVFLATDQVVEVAGCAHHTAGGVVSIVGGRLDAVGRRRSGAVPADHSVTCRAVQVRGHVGGRTRGWKRKEAKSLKLK